ncbi:MAG: ergothioneine biosynthesis protein EgtB [Maricaulis sp.]|uniref:ergothioneine biosynthesis protein EgtB n=1 Tax=Maricaulis sp. TaxID=1486257 RepID=UPI002627DF58|nr:ergothioneine biosynthesis protein EgtB [Maricaulis sp.]MDM7985571.1 ergothioneine biosynthesis protein EgtB [Maricaulis sp.]
MDDQIYSSLFSLYSGVRERTQLLVSGFSAEDMTVQTMPDVSPTKWHLAHTTWFWECFVLRDHLEGYQEYSPEFNYLFNSYYEQVGARHARPERGFLTRPSAAEVLAYRAHVDAAMERLLSGNHEIDFAQVKALVELGVAHEEQHQELLVTDIKHVLSKHPFSPQAWPADTLTSSELPELSWHAYEAGLYAFGHEAEGFHFDNEGPRHKYWLEAFALASRPVSNGEYLKFMADGGYSTAPLWLSEGWAAVNERGWAAPLYWRQRDGEWFEFTLAGERPVDPAAPVTHLSYFEASAFAEWAGARLPEEREWELAAAKHDPGLGDALVPDHAPHPRSRPDQDGYSQLFGGVWEWTRSAYSAYPRYRPAAGAVGEYNGKFMCGQFVLRGGSCATPLGHVRASYRNFFPPDARWQFSGLRLAKDI